MSERSELTVDSLDKLDAEEVAAVHRLAFEGYLNTRIGSDYLLHMLLWFRTASGGIAVVARDQGSVVGYVVGAPDGYQAQMNRDLMWVAARGIVTHPWALADANFRRALWWRGSSLFRRAPKSIPHRSTGKGHALVGIAVAPACCGRGVGKLLLSTFEREARQLGAGSVRLTVYESNTAARTLYERGGWVGEAKPESPDLMSYTKVLA